MIDTKIFRDYDIRGVYPDEINEEVYFTLGQAIAEYLKVNSLAVGYDMRLSSKSLFKALTDGIRDRGTDIINLGMISSEINYFASGKFRFSANIIVSASHNPPEYNGLKIVKKDVVPLHGGMGLPEIKKLALRGSFAPLGKKGKMVRKNIFSAWIAHVLKEINPHNLHKFTLVIDAGNGMAGPTWTALAPKLPVKIIAKYFKPDGRFPNHLPDPLKKENLILLTEEVISKKADFGFAMDGDADRFFVVDDLGMFLNGTVTGAMLAEHLLNKRGKGSILYSVTCGRILPETVVKMNGTPVRTRVGHSIIKEKMKEHNAIFAAEHSGHFYFRDNYYADSSTMAALLFLEFMSQKNAKLSKVRKNYEVYSQSGELNFKVDNQHKIFDNLEREFAKEKIDRLDGMTVNSFDWWFNVRASKTEALLRLNIEADNRDILNKKTEILTNLLVKMGAVQKG